MFVKGRLQFLNNRAVFVIGGADNLAAQFGDAVLQNPALWILADSGLDFWYTRGGKSHRIASPKSSSHFRARERSTP
jgi:hypothetical protein